MGTPDLREAVRRERQKDTVALPIFLNMTIFALAIAVLLVLPGISWAQISDPAGQAAISHLMQQVQELQQHDRDLEERIKVLEGNRAGTPSPSSQPSAPDVVPSQPPVEEQAVILPTEMHTVHGIQWHGFAEVDYRVLNQRKPETGFYGAEPGSAGNFYTGDFGLFLTSRLTNKSSVLSEIIFEEGDAQTFKVDLRRMLLKYDYNEHLKVSFGRYQTSIGYYNWEFRSAAWLQTTADRPLVMEFASSGGILPTQATGVSVTGRIPSGKLGLNYVAEYGSADTIRPDINGDGILTDENNSNQVNVAFFVRPDYLHGLQVGDSLFHDRISNLNYLASGGGLAPGTSNDIPNELSARWNQTIVNGHIVYVSPRIEFLNEGFLIRDSLIGGTIPFNTPAFYSQLSRRFGSLRPFIRYQYVNSSSRNIVYDDIGLRYGPSFGARYDLNDYFAFKAQLDHTMRRGLPDLNGLHLQMSATF